MIKPNNIYKILSEFEVPALHNQPSIIWEKADKFWIYDSNNRKYIDFCSGILIANAGYNHPKMIKRIKQQLKTGVLTSYTFLNRERAELISRLSTKFPEKNYKITLFNSGSEAVEACIKSALNWATLKFNHSKNILISFDNSFHGRTMASQYAGGIKKLKNWLPPTNSFIQFPYPDNFYCKDLSFDNFLKSIKKNNINSDNIAAVLIESYQGGICSFAPKKYMEDLRIWCSENDVLLIIDEVQSGFGRTGKWWGYEHFGIIPDLISSGKGISSSLPLSAMIGRADILDLIPIGTISSTHTANPICCAAAVANFDILTSENLVTNAEKLGPIIEAELGGLVHQYPDYIRALFGKGLVYALHIGSSITNSANPSLAYKIIQGCIEHGLMMCNPVGPECATIKINPPLCIDKSNIITGCNIIKSVIDRAINN